MNKATEHRDSKSQARKLSPELNEFLHMLKALEGQAAESAALQR